jgi:hypothetical protein
VHGTADEASAPTVTVRVLWTDRTRRSNSRDLTLKVAPAGKHGTRRADPGVDRFDPGTKATVG